MFTSRTERSASYIQKKPTSLGPGCYNTNNSTLKLSSYHGMAPFNSRQKKSNFLDSEVRRYEQFPPVGEYQPTIDPEYIRGQRQSSSFFASASQRFVPVKSTVPGPAEYFEQQFVVEKPQSHIVKQSIKDQIDTVSSIPYEREKQKQFAHLNDERSSWIKENAGEELNNPAPSFIVVKKKVEQEELSIPAGGACTSLAHVDAEHAWARAPERDEQKQTLEEMNLAPGKYYLPSDFKVDKQYDSEGNTKKSAAFLTSADRYSFVPKKDDIQGPGAYYVEGYESIEEREYKIKQELELKELQKEHIEKVEQLNAKLLPGIEPTKEEETDKDSRCYYTAIERAMMENPAVGTYTGEIISPSPYIVTQPKQSQSALQKLSLQQTFNSLKWPETACSIPAVVITDEEPQQETQQNNEEMNRSAKIPLMDKQLNRNIEKIELSQATGQIGPGDYELRTSLKKKNFSTKPSYAFADTYPRDSIYGNAKQNELEQEILEQNEMTYLQNQQEERQVGGYETALNFTNAKYSGANQSVKFGSSLDRTDMDTIMEGRDLTVPGVGEYFPENSRETRLPIVLNAEEREISYQQQFGKIPSALKPEIAGPGAEKAAEILIERKLDATNLGPGSYQSVKKIGKRSFNSRAEDNVI